MSPARAGSQSKGAGTHPTNGAFVGGSSLAAPALATKLNQLRVKASL